VSAQTTHIDDAPLPEPTPPPLRLEMPERLVVVGDLNGHLHLLDRLLSGVGLTDARGRWVGGDAALVQMGDLINRGGRSRGAMDRLLRLRAEARAAGGEVVWLLGNHEAMTALGHEAYVTAEEYLEFAEPASVARFLDDRTRYVYEILGPPRVPHRVPPIGGRVRAWEEANAPGQDAFRSALGAQGIYGRHIRSLPVCVQVGRLLFVHGGLAPMWAELGVEGLDMMRREAWGRAPESYQDLAPDGLFRDPLGPLWHRAYCISEVAAVAADVRGVLARLEAARMVVGHTRTETVSGTHGEPLLRQRGQVVMTDVGIGEPGEPGAVLIVEGGHIDVWSPLEGRYPLAPVEPG
jgi:hypothetical protein